MQDLGKLSGLVVRRRKLFQTSWRRLREVCVHWVSNCNIILPFKLTIHAYLLKISITHNKKHTPLLNLLISSILPRPPPQLLLIKDDCTFSFSNFLKIGLCNSLVKFLNCTELQQERNCHLLEQGYRFLNFDKFCKFASTFLTDKWYFSIND